MGLLIVLLLLPLVAMGMGQIVMPISISSSEVGKFYLMWIILLVFCYLSVYLIRLL